MTARTCKLLGKAWGDPTAPVRLVVTWKGQTVYDGSVPTLGGTPDPTATDYVALCTWPIADEDRGIITLQLQGFNGSVLINNIVMNNVRESRFMHLKDGVTWPKHQPSDWEDFRLDIEALSDAEFLDLYGFARSDAQNYTEFTIVAPEDNWVDGNFNNRDANGYYTDGKTNVAINGVALAVPPPKTNNYEQSYFFRSGDILSMDYLIEWDQ